MIFVALESAWDGFAYPVDVTRAVCGEGSESPWFCNWNRCAFVWLVACVTFLDETTDWCPRFGLSASFVSLFRVRCIVFPGFSLLQVNE